uniref:Uncharacterized protein n=1 Tax=Tanacetum cinerariifolium TaxID=118510 RepID=A0A699LA68_TANCI|nr:hypothetical protein [Tanacetum cinerariifolium]
MYLSIFSVSLATNLVHIRVSSWKRSVYVGTSFPLTFSVKTKAHSLHIPSVILVRTVAFVSIGGVPHKGLINHILNRLWSHFVWVSVVRRDIRSLSCHRRQAQMVESLRVMGDMRREMGDMQAELLALREQPRRARQPGLDTRVPDHQDDPRDAVSHI